MEDNWKSLFKVFPQVISLYFDQVSCKLKFPSSSYSIFCLPSTSVLAYLGHQYYEISLYDKKCSCIKVNVMTFFHFEAMYGPFYITLHVLNTKKKTKKMISRIQHGFLKVFF